MWQRFLFALMPLVESGKMGAVLLQFPPWFLANRDNSRHIEHCADMLEEHTVAVEFRNAGWLGERAQSRTIAGLKELGLSLVIVDEPQGFRSSVPFVPVVTNPNLSYVRFHGRNAEMWEAKGLTSSTQRFNYLYSESELKDFLSPMETLASEAKEVRVYFNNNYKNYAQANALQLRMALGQV
jgi:uncharacterized protein YecE (DUF72 family)